MEEAEAEKGEEEDEDGGTLADANAAALTPGIINAGGRKGRMHLASLMLGRLLSVGKDRSTRQLGASTNSATHSAQQYSTLHAFFHLPDCRKKK